METEEFVKHVIQDVKSQLSEMKGDIRSMHDKIDDLRSFKVRIITMAQTRTFVISSVAGFVTLISTMLLVYFTAKH